MEVGQELKAGGVVAREDPRLSFSQGIGWSSGCPLPGALGWGTKRAVNRHWLCHSLWRKQTARVRNKQRHVRSLQK